uniref:Uncharacterized protein n=1 Tax=Strigamia maritima TaxID=126957 RepID=T1IVS5_STRMM
MDTQLIAAIFICFSCRVYYLCITRFLLMLGIAMSTAFGHSFALYKEVRCILILIIPVFVGQSGRIIIIAWIRILTGSDQFKSITMSTSKIILKLLRSKVDVLNLGFINVRRFFWDRICFEIPPVVDAICLLVNEATRLSAFSFIFFLRKFSVNYHTHNMLNIEYDNIYYITDYFERIDARRKQQSSGNILPQKKKRNGNVVISLINDEKREFLRLPRSSLTDLNMTDTFYIKFDQSGDYHRMFMLSSCFCLITQKKFIMILYKR